jgi:hypothetical protein
MGMETICQSGYRLGVEEVPGDNLNTGDADLPAVGRFIMMIMIF